MKARGIGLAAIAVATTTFACQGRGGAGGAAVTCEQADSATQTGCTQKGTICSLASTGCDHFAVCDGDHWIQYGECYGPLNGPVSAGEPVPSDCGSAPYGTDAPVSESEFVQLAAHPWAICMGDPVGAEFSHGLDISPDGTWSQLCETAYGVYVRDDTPDGSGTWTVEELDPQTFALTLKRGNASSFVLHPVFSSTLGPNWRVIPQWMNVDSTKSAGLTYVRLPGLGT